MLGLQKHHHRKVWDIVLFRIQWTDRNVQIQRNEQMQNQIEPRQTENEALSTSFSFVVGLSVRTKRHPCVCDNPQAHKWLTDISMRVLWNCSSTWPTCHHPFWKSSGMNWVQKARHGVLSKGISRHCAHSRQNEKCSSNEHNVRHNNPQSRDQYRDWGIQTYENDGCNVVFEYQTIWKFMTLVIDLKISYKQHQNQIRNCLSRTNTAMAMTSRWFWACHNNVLRRHNS